MYRLIELRISSVTAVNRAPTRPVIASRTSNWAYSTSPSKAPRDDRQLSPDIMMIHLLFVNFYTANRLELVSRESPYRVRDFLSKGERTAHADHDSGQLVEAFVVGLFKCTVDHAFENIPQMWTPSGK